LIAGSGPLRGELESIALGALPDHVRFLGFMNQLEIGRAYRAADLMVVPSVHEPWGLVVNEAMNFGLPCLVSDRVGSGPDLVVPNKTGDVFIAGSYHSLCERLEVLLSNPSRLQEMGENARARIKKWGFSQCETGLRAALEYIGCSP
jgi:glycosyltransferase involved in cell wall biosynthesis